MSEVKIEAGRLVCPKCAETYLHHGKTRIFTRLVEDGTHGCLVESDGFNTTVATNAPMDDCPSRRRDGMTIAMYCEMCADIGNLVILQHKGETFMEWDLI